MVYFFRFYSPKTRQRSSAYGKKTKQIYINILSSLHKFNPHAQLRFGLFISASFLLSCLSLLVNRKTVVLRRKENETFGFEIQVTFTHPPSIPLSLLILFSPFIQALHACLRAYYLSEDNWILDDELIGSLFPVHRQAVLREASALSRIWAQVCVG